MVTFKRKVRENVIGYIFILPALLGIILFTATPFFLSLYYSFTKYEVLTPPEWIGLQNFSALVGDEVFLNSLKITLIYAVISVVLSLTLSYFLALLLNTKLKGVKAYRVLIYTPCIIPAVASAAIFRDMFNPTYVGTVNRFFNLFHLGPFPWFASQKTAMLTLIVLSLWGMGGNMLMWIAGFNGVAPSYYEAAELDGASKFEQMIFITLPMVSPVIFYNLVIGIITSLQAFGSAYLLTAGGPLYATNFLTLNIYNEGIGRLNMGYACAQAWILFLIILMLTVVVFKTSGWVYYDDSRGSSK